eukprot:7202130-Ditylum_brightwellii.AAC.1
MLHMSITKKLDPKIGHLPARQAETNPWETLCVDLIGSYIIHRKGTHKNGKKKKDLILWCVTMIDLGTGWFEITEIKKGKCSVQCC